MTIDQTWVSLIQAAFDEFQDALERADVPYAATITDSAQKAALSRLSQCFELGAKDRYQD